MQVWGGTKRACGIKGRKKSGAGKGEKWYAGKTPYEVATRECWHGGGETAGIPSGQVVSGLNRGKGAKVNKYQGKKGGGGGVVWFRTKVRDQQSGGGKTAAGGARAVPNGKRVEFLKKTMKNKKKVDIKPQKRNKKKEKKKKKKKKKK